MKKYVWDQLCHHTAKVGRVAGSNQQPVPLTDYGSVCRQSWSQHLLICRTRCTIYWLPPLLLAIFCILWWWKTTEADAPTIRLDATPSGLSMPLPPSSPPYLRRMPFLPQPSQFILAWDRHRVMQIMGNTVTSAKMPPPPKKTHKIRTHTHTHTHTHNRLTAFCPGLPG